jgi:hydroxyacylglutathione hydrolase
MTLKSWTTRNGLKIYRVLGGRSNVFLLTNGMKNILVDTSAQFMKNALIENLRKLNIHQIDYLVLTHSHFDHAANAAFVKDWYDAKIIIHKNESHNLETGKNIVPAGTGPFSKLIVRFLASKYMMKLDYEPCKPDILVDETFDFKEMGFGAYLLHTPGHTPGSMSLIINHEIALVGDAMVGTFPNSCYPPFALDTDEVVKSWGKLLDTGCRWFMPSHGSARSRELVEKEYRKRI